MTSFGTPKILTGEEAEEALTKQRLTVEQSKKMARLLRSEQKKEGNSTNQKSQRSVGVRNEKNTGLEQQILASGPIFHGRFQQCFFEIHDFRLQGVSTVIGEGAFEGFWNNVELRQMTNFQSRCRDFREHLWEVWLAQVAEMKINKSKSDKKRVNRWEYVNCWRRICSIAGWFWQDFPPELTPLYDAFCFYHKSRLEIEPEAMCFDLYNTWKVNGYIHSADRRYEESAYDFLIEFSELKQSARYSRIGPTGYPRSDSEQSETATADVDDGINFFDSDGKTPTKHLFGESIDEDPTTALQELPELMTKPRRQFGLPTRLISL